MHEKKYFMTIIFKNIPIVIQKSAIRLEPTEMRPEIRNRKSQNTLDTSHYKQ